MRTDRHMRSTDLFLVRVWSGPAIDGSGEVNWHGKLQRTVDGEAHLFSSWQDLVEKLSAMLPAAEGVLRSTKLDDKGPIEIRGENNES